MLYFVPVLMHGSGSVAFLWTIF